MPTFNAKRFADAIREKRIADDIFFRELGEMLGIDYSLLCQIAKQHKGPGVTNFARLCTWLGVPMETFFDTPSLSGEGE